MQTSMNEGEKYRVVAPEAMHETFMSDSEEEGGTFNRKRKHSKDFESKNNFF